MSGHRWRFGTLCAVLSAAAIIVSLQPAGFVTAEDKSDSSATRADAAGDASSGKAPSSKKSKAVAKSKKKTTKKAPAKKKSQSNSSQQPVTDGQGSGSSSGGSAGGGVIGGAGVGGAGSTPTGVPSPNGGGGNGGAGRGENENGPQNNPGPDPDELQRVIDAQNKHTPGLMKQEGVVGTATGITKDGKAFIKVYKSGAGKPVIPDQLEGVEVKAVLAGVIRPFFDGAAGLPQYNPKARQKRPVPIGVSAFNEDTPACGGSACSAGTLGCRLKARDGSGVFGLSNNHVFADLNAASLGTSISQPSALDNNCACAPGDNIGRLVGFKTINTSGGVNIMDAAIIRTSEAVMSNRTLPDGYGAPLTLTIKNAQLGTKAQKYGRTTGYTKGSVTAINATINVGYTAGTAIFVEQIEFTGDDGVAFGDHGDSGSLIVAADRRPIALLFSGDDVTHVVFGNPIQPVLDFFKMDVDGADVPVVIPRGKIGSSGPN